MITFPALREFAARCDALSIAVPVPATRALELFDVAQAALQPTPRRLLDLDDDAVADVVTDMAIREHTANTSSNRGLAPGLDPFERQLLSEVRAAMMPLLDDLIASMQPRFDKQVAPIVTAVQAHNFTGRTSAAQVLERRNWKDIQAFMAARDAMRDVQPLVSFRQSVSTTFDVAPLGYPVDYSVAFAADDNWSLEGDFNREQKHPGLVDLVALASGGLHLNTVSEVEAKLQGRRDREFQDAFPDVFTQPKPSWSEEDLEAAVDGALERASKES